MDRGYWRVSWQVRKGFCWRPGAGVVVLARGSLSRAVTVWGVVSVRVAQMVA